MKQREYKPLGKTGTAFVDGDRSSKYPSRSEYCETGVLFLNGESISTGRIDIKAANHIPKSKYDSITKGRIQYNDILITTRGNSIGDSAYVGIKENGLINAQMLIIRNRSTNDLCQRFLYYYLHFRPVRELISSFSSGSAQPQIPIRDLRCLPVWVPKKGTQRKIAAILSAYDDLIEVNERRIALLEKMAEEIFREWFVRMRFPGHSNNATAMIPDGWEKTKAEKYLSIYRGTAYSSETISDTKLAEKYIPFINLKNVLRGGGFRVDGTKYYSGEYKKTQVVSGGSIIIAATDMTQDRAIIGQAARIPNGFIEKAIISSDVIRVVPMNIEPSFLYALLRYSGFSNQLKELANGANVLHLQPDLVCEQKVLIPGEKLQKRFAALYDQFLAETDLLRKRNLTMEETRDRLLTRLMSGALDVEKLDIAFPPSMEEESAAEGVE